MVNVYRLKWGSLYRIYLEDKDKIYYLHPDGSWRCPPPASLVPFTGPPLPVTAESYMNNE